MGKTGSGKKSSASSSGPGQPRKAAVCGDGITIANFEELSRQASGKGTIQEWRDAVVDALRNAKGGDATLKYKGVNTITSEQAKLFNQVGDALSGKTAGTTKYTSTAQLESLLTGKVPGLHQFGNVDAAGKWVNHYPKYRMPMWMYLKKKGLAYEGFWQHETKASFVNASGKTVYVDPTEVPYLVSNVAPVGTFVKVTAPNGMSTYARILESGTEKAEVSIKTWRNLGYPKTTPSGGAPVSQLNIQPFPGSGSLGPRGSRSFEENYLNNDEIQRAGKLIEDGKVKSISSRKDLERAEGKGNQQASADPAAAPAGGGGYRLEKGFPTVAIGQTMRLVGYAAEPCVHDGGGYVMEGSATVYVGKYPFARIDDATSDELAVLTGDETVFVGGPPTTATLA